MQEADLSAPVLPRAFSRIGKEHGWTKGEAFKEKHSKWFCM